MGLHKRIWSEVSGGNMSLENIQALHLPAQDYRLAFNAYKAGVNFLGKWGVPTTIYVLDGNCRYVIDQDSLVLNALEFADVDVGNYSFEVLGETEVCLVMAFKLPISLHRDLGCVPP